MKYYIEFKHPSLSDWFSYNKSKTLKKAIALLNSYKKAYPSKEGYTWRIIKKVVVV